MLLLSYHQEYKIELNLQQIIRILWDGLNATNRIIEQLEELHIMEIADNEADKGYDSGEELWL